MLTVEEIESLPSLENQALILYTGNMHRNDYDTTSYFEMNITLKDEVLVILERKPVSDINRFLWYRTTWKRSYNKRYEM